MFQIIVLLSVSAVLFALCASQDRKMDAELQFLIQYRRIQERYKKD